ncbi:hypothetical protein BEWA_009030 [Theileria equi strain WA]|uniref:Uncharacterized protein n=1 Tax=Theileria equi strain WA TaxID=1537102 RepID=L0B2P5_THEEQ|nr:hypothetical protein BEWA_009030 [Theileria equi strain WA]AFZ81491.1 hypothetical protein BEWA_009030 [Theileria equi strain WA]|eukprot:XP_004831157.1 hypothetical protein BEWA_009030 [Theileria equi strain WA]
MNEHRSKNKGSKPKKSKKPRHKMEKVVFNDEVEVIHVEDSYSDGIEFEDPNIPQEDVVSVDSSDENPVEQAQELEEKADNHEKVTDVIEESVITTEDIQEGAVTESCSNNAHRTANAIEPGMTHNEILQMTRLNAQKLLKGVMDNDNYHRRRTEHINNIELSLNAHKRKLERTRDKYHLPLFRHFTPAKVALEKRETGAIKNFPFIFSKTVQEHLLFAERTKEKFESMFEKVSTNKVQVSKETDNLGMNSMITKPKKESTVTPENAGQEHEKVYDCSWSEPSIKTSSDSDWDKVTNISSGRSFTRIDSSRSLSSRSLPSVVPESTSIFSRVYENFRTFCRNFCVQDNTLQDTLSYYIHCYA